MHNTAFTIGLFDSGVGGLSVLRQLERVVDQYPQYASYRFVYLGDTARCPYGDRDQETVTRFVLQIVDWLQNKGANCLVMACNTSAACAGAATRAASSVPVYDLIGATAEYVASKGLKTAVLATAGTVRAQAFSRAIVAADSDAQVTEIACPELVPLIEQGLIDSVQTRDALWRYVKGFASQGVEAAILGCTHYPFLREQLADLLPGVELIDPAEHLAKVLINHPVAIGNRPSITRELFVTGAPDTFQRTAEICLGQPVGTVSGITVAELESSARLIAIPHSVTQPISEALGSTGTLP